MEYLPALSRPAAAWAPPELTAPILPGTNTCDPDAMPGVATATEEQTRMVVSAASQVPVLGDINAARYLCRIHE